MGLLQIPSKTVARFVETKNQRIEVLNRPRTSRKNAERTDHRPDPGDHEHAR